MRLSFAPGGIGHSLRFTESEEAQNGGTTGRQGNGAPAVGHQASGIVIETMPKDVKVKYGDEVVLVCHAHTPDNRDLKYQWYKKKGGEKIQVLSMSERKLHVRMHMVIDTYCYKYVDGFALYHV